MPSKKNRSRSNTPASNVRQDTPTKFDSSKCDGEAVINVRLKNYDKEEKREIVNLDAAAALEDVHTRFILNLPPKELATSDRIFFQLEQAWWFYDDFVCDGMDESSGGKRMDLPRFKHLYPFAKKMFQISPLLGPMFPQFDEMWEEFSTYRRKISTYGTIILNAPCTRILLCRDWNGKSWTLPAGKVNQNESGIEAGARETYEETGFDPNCNLGQTHDMRNRAKVDGTELPWKRLQEKDALVYTEADSGKQRTCYICRGVPESFPFEPVTRKEVSDVAWYEIDSIPKKNFAIIPFMQQLKRWIRKNCRHGSKQRREKEEEGGEDQRRSSTQKKRRGDSSGRSSNPSREATPIERRTGSTKRERSGSKSSKNERSGSRNHSRGKIRANDNLLKAGLGGVGEDRGWTEEDMFRTNEGMIGKKVEYDGNPQRFANEGFNGIDPHSFRVVGGEFMNSGGISTIAKSPDVRKLQPLYPINTDAKSERKDNNTGNDSDDNFKPFFSNGGATPWGDIVAEALAEDAASAQITPSIDASTAADISLSFDEPAVSGSNASGLALLSRLRANQSDGVVPKTGSSKAGVKEELMIPSSTSVLNTSKIHTNITYEKGNKKKEDKNKVEKLLSSQKDDSLTRIPKSTSTKCKDYYKRKLEKWVKNLSQAPKLTDEFTFDVDAILGAIAMKNAT